MLKQFLLLYEQPKNLGQYIRRHRCHFESPPKHISYFQPQVAKCL